MLLVQIGRLEAALADGLVENRRRQPRALVELGQTVSVSVDATRVHLFEPSAGARLSR